MKFIDDIWPVVSGEGPVLIVDDSLDLAVSQAVAERFSRDCRPVQLAGDTREALELYERSQPSLIALCDIGEGGEAIAFLKELEEKRRGDPIQVCVITETWQSPDPMARPERVVAVSPSFSICELLDITRELRAA